nr:GHKL domain-containing protein [Clostridioides sp.]
MLESKIFWFLLDFFATSIEWYAVKVIFDKLNNIKKNKCICNLCYIFGIILVLTMTIFDIEPNTKLIVNFFLINAIYMYFYEVKFIRSIFISTIYSLIMIGFDTLSISLIVFINSLNSIDLVMKIHSIYRFELYILSKLLIVLLLFLIKSSNGKLNINTQEYIFFHIPIFTNLFSIMVIFGFLFKKGDLTRIEGYVILMATLLIIMANIALIYIISKIIRGNNIRIENKIIKDNVEKQYIHYLRMEKEQSKIKQLYHDMNNHMIYIKTIYGDNEKSNEYIESLDRQINEIKLPFSTNNMTLDVILNDKKYICENKGISLVVNINFSMCDFINMVDVCSIFSNILDNAIEACEKIDSKLNRYINLRGSVVKGFYVIICENTRTNEINFDGGKIKTDKKDIFFHGIGINSVKSSIDKYNGNVEIKILDGVFQVLIIIPLEN